MLLLDASSPLFIVDNFRLAAFPIRKRREMFILFSGRKHFTSPVQHFSLPKERRGQAKKLMDKRIDNET
jgi:hypothetical protein